MRSRSTRAHSIKSVVVKGGRLGFFNEILVSVPFNDAAAVASITPDESQLASQLRDQADVAAFIGGLSERRKFPPVTLGIFVVCVLAYLVEAVLSGTAAPSPNNLARFGGCMRALIADGEWYRLITAGFLHADPIHLAMNMVALFWFGAFCEHCLGSRAFGAIYLVSLVGASVTSALLLPPMVVSVGASGAVFGLIGAAMAMGIHGGLPQSLGKSLVHKGILYTVLQLAGIYLQFVLGELGSDALGSRAPWVIDFAAHLGGIVIGLVATLALIRNSQGYGANAAITGKRIGSIAAAAVALVIISVPLVKLRTDSASDDWMHSSTAIATPEELQWMQRVGDGTSLSPQQVQRLLDEAPDSRNCHLLTLRAGLEMQSFATSGTPRHPEWLEACPNDEQICPNARMSCLAASAYIRARSGKPDEAAKLLRDASALLPQCDPMLMFDLAAKCVASYHDSGGADQLRPIMIDAWRRVSTHPQWRSKGGTELDCIIAIALLEEGSREEAERLIQRLVGTKHRDSLAFEHGLIAYYSGFSQDGRREFGKVVMAKGGGSSASRVAFAQRVLAMRTGDADVRFVRARFGATPLPPSEGAAVEPGTDAKP